MVMASKKTISTAVADQQRPRPRSSKTNNDGGDGENEGPQSMRPLKTMATTSRMRRPARINFVSNAGLSSFSSLFGCACLLLSQQRSVAYSPPKVPLPSRRTIVERLVGDAGIAGMLLVVGPAPAQAARGAFELDSEYYLRTLVGGNKKEGNVLPSKAPPVPPSRSLQGPLIPLLLDNNYSPSCIPVQVLSEQIASQQGNTSPSTVAKSIADTAMDYRTKSSRSFFSRAPWNKEDVSDQYYFDLTAYAFWKTAAESLPKYTDRDVFVRNVGRRLYENLKVQTQQKELRPKSVVASESAVITILQAFQASNFCKGYRIGTDQSADKKPDEKVCDSLDDEALLSGATVDILVSVYEPATLGASLQITGEQSRFAPDYIGPTLAALWESQGIKSSWEVFFVDPEYRPNPKDYFPNEKLLQFTLSL